MHDSYRYITYICLGIGRPSACGVLAKEVHLEVIDCKSSGYGMQPTTEHRKGKEFLKPANGSTIAECVDWMLETACSLLWRGRLWLSAIEQGQNQHIVFVM